MPTNKLRRYFITSKLDETYWFDWSDEASAGNLKRTCNNNQRKTERME